MASMCMKYRAFPFGRITPVLDSNTLVPNPGETICSMANDGLTWLSESEHTRVHREFSDFLYSKYGKYFMSQSGPDWMVQLPLAAKIR